VSPAKTAKLIMIPFGLWARVGPRNHILHGVHIPHGKGQFLGGKRWHIVKHRDLPASASSSTAPTLFKKQDSE